MQPGHRISRHGASFVLPSLLHSLLLGLTLGLHTLLHNNWSHLLPISVAVVALSHFLHNRQHKWELTTEQIIARTGILVRRTQVIRLDRITDITVQTPLLASLFGTGAIQISTAGSDGVELTVFRQHQANKIEAHIARAKRAYVSSNPRDTNTD